jgi:hypothetical protein
VNVRRFVAAALVLLSTACLAQEIGKEVPDNKPPPGGNPTTYDNPYAPPPNVPAQAEPGAKVAGPSVPGPRKGAFGIRANFGGSGFGGVTGTGNAASISSPTFGLKYYATDQAGITFDLGAVLALIGSNALVAFAAGIGVDYHFGSPDKPVRPFFTIGGGLISAATSRGLSLGLTATVGGGGEYWFSDYFSVNARVVTSSPISLDPFILIIATVSPGIGATIYF